MNRNYFRVLPRDLFNEAKLLKCVGRLCLLIHDRTAPESLAFEENGEPFRVALLDEGSLTIANLVISVHGCGAPVKPSPIDFWISTFKPRTAKWKRDTLRRLKKSVSTFETKEENKIKIKALETLLA